MKTLSPLCWYIVLPCAVRNAISKYYFLCAFEFPTSIYYTHWAKDDNMMIFFFTLSLWSMDVSELAWQLVECRGHRCKVQWWGQCSPCLHAISDDQSRSVVSLESWSQHAEIDCKELVYKSSVFQNNMYTLSIEQSDWSECYKHGTGITSCALEEILWKS